MSKRKIGCCLLALTLITFLLSITIAAESTVQKPLVYLNHLYLTLDSTTFQEFTNSKFWDNFASYFTSTVKADSNESWTGFYVYGENTYFEVFAAEQPEYVGFTGIGFGVETENGIDSLLSRCQSMRIENVTNGLRHRDIDGQKIPWFYWFGFEPTDSGSARMISNWVMEYRYDYLKVKYPNIDPDSLKITRKFYINKDYNSDLLLKDIVELELALGETDIKNIIEEMKFFGYQFEKKETLIIANGPNIKIIIKPKSENELGACRIKFSLTDKPYEPQIVKFGNKSKLILNEDKTAEWYISI